MSLRLREFPNRGFLVWFALSAGIVAWIIHLSGFAALVTFVHDHGGYFWLFDVGNGVTLAVTLVALWLSWRMAEAGSDEEEGTEAGRMRFLGVCGLLINSINLMLIALEGSYVYFLRTGR